MSDTPAAGLSQGAFGVSAVYGCGVRTVHLPQETFNALLLL